MAFQIKMSEPKLIYAAPVNEATKKWGVYCIPRMWRLPSGQLVIRFNGEEDSCLVEEMQRAPNLFFVSDDNGENWTPATEEDGLFDLNALLGIDAPYLKLRDGSWIAIREQNDRQPITGTPHRKEFTLPDREAIVYSYRYGDIPEACKGIELLRFRDGKYTVCPSEMDFGEREVLVNALAHTPEDTFVPVPQLLRPYIFKSPYLSCLNELADGTLVGVTCGQHPQVDDHNCGIVYLVASTDGGITWKKRGVIAEDTNKLPFGYGGDGFETTLTVAENGDLLCAMRMDMTINLFFERPLCDTKLAISHDNGFTWEQPISVSDCSVTPHVEALKDGIVFLAYGRPGVHCKCSCDNGKTWSNSFSIIGKTLEEERAAGRNDLDSKYMDTCSYSNLFVEKLSDDSVLMLYTDLKYDPGDGLHHKAGFVRKITVTKV